MTRRIVVAVTGPRRGAFGPRFLVGCALRWYGAQALQVRPGDDLSQLQYDAVVVTGGHDIDPVIYAAEPEVHPKYDAERDALELAVIDDALARNLPLLGICRGAQLLNARRGGNLFQELKSHRKMTSNRWTILPLKTLNVEPSSRLWRLLMSDNCRINSLHNQAIDKVGEGLIVSGRDLDGIVQAVEDPRKPFLLGVQWHPEFLLFYRRQRLLFQALIQAVRSAAE
ncbi:gamma-glutamyl-gamma-aminobutyrate hydrolase family protein [Halopseudomonas pelagia]|uniref:Gamma-glutamyl-gamma-aminobutyrate hydrolase family protein n=1 Tax=Halopseudomonas pelagia TaxID=553151 RepID=A0AA91U3Q8_9GAMM|nr:gamma-glutamyl-gamma-aminobutyrate hydrolase family protein [Halopseudomonas pelagia]PCD00043.1 peptidase C26 [Halopseudomonas pelagia]QFY55633.1 gamma-glutamyl-gamma-aminobutyrate hydrolase family protein [Halopseudomonas pelagia]